MKSIYFAILLLFYSVTFSQGVSRGVSSLKFPFTPFVAATGESFVADTMNSQSVLINPANLASNKFYSILFSHIEWVQDIRTEYLSVIMPLRLGSFALSIGNTSIDDIEIRDVPGPSLGTFNSQSTFFQLTYGVGLTDKIHIGISPKYIYEKIYIDEANGFGVDAGLLYFPPIKDLVLGCSITSLGNISEFRTEKTDLPTQLRIGGAYTYPLDMIVLRTAAAFSSELGISMNHFNLGLEAIYNNSFSSRFGYRSNYKIGGFSFGLGIPYSIFVVDYSYLSSSYQLGNAHIISVSTIF